MLLATWLLSKVSTGAKKLAEKVGGGGKGNYRPPQSREISMCVCSKQTPNNNVTLPKSSHTMSRSSITTMNTMELLWSHSIVGRI